MEKIEPIEAQGIRVAPFAKFLKILQWCWMPLPRFEKGIRPSHRRDFSGYSQISGFRFLLESIKKDVEVHFERDFSPLRIQTFKAVQPMPWYFSVFLIFAVTAATFTMLMHHRYGFVALLG